MQSCTQASRDTVGVGRSGCRIERKQLHWISRPIHGSFVGCHIHRSDLLLAMAMAQIHSGTIPKTIYRWSCKNECFGSTKTLEKCGFKFVFTGFYPILAGEFTNLKRHIVNNEFSLSIDMNSAVKLKATTSMSNIFFFPPIPDLNSNSKSLR